MTSARLRTLNGDGVELSVVGYQFPDLPNVPYDSNWLVIEGTASIGGQSWTFRDACLLTYEVAALAHWLERHGAGGMIDDELSFLEPNLSVRRVSAGAIRMFFALECAPPWSAPGEDWEAYFVEAPVDKEAFQAAALALRDALRSWPQRTAE